MVKLLQFIVSNILDFMYHRKEVTEYEKNALHSDLTSHHILCPDLLRVADNFGRARLLARGLCCLYADFGGKKPHLPALRRFDSQSGALG